MRCSAVAAILQAFDAATLEAALDGVKIDGEFAKASSGRPCGGETGMKAGLFKSISEARKTIKAGGVYLNDTRVEDEEQILNENDFLSAWSFRIDPSWQEGPWRRRKRVRQSRAAQANVSEEQQRSSSRNTRNIRNSMAEEQRGSRGKSYGNHKSYGSGKPGNRGGKGFKPRGNGGKSYGHKAGGFHNDDHKGGYRKGNGGNFHRDRDFRRDGEGEGQERRFHNGPRKFNRDGERRDDHRGYRGGRGDNPRYQRDGERSGFRRDDRRDGDRRRLPSRR